MSLESIALATYSCPNCRAELEAELGAWGRLAAVPRLWASVVAAGAGRSSQ